MCCLRCAHKSSFQRACGKPTKAGRLWQHNGFGSPILSSTSRMMTNHMSIAAPVRACHNVAIKWPLGCNKIQWITNSSKHHESKFPMALHTPPPAWHRHAKASSDEKIGRSFVFKMHILFSWLDHPLWATHFTWARPTHSWRETRTPRTPRTHFFQKFVLFCFSVNSLYYLRARIPIYPFTCCTIAHTRNLRDSPLFSHPRDMHAPHVHHVHIFFESFVLFCFSIDCLYYLRGIFPTYAITRTFHLAHKSRDLSLFSQAPEVHRHGAPFGPPGHHHSFPARIRRRGRGFSSACRRPPPPQARPEGGTRLKSINFSWL